MDSILYRMDYWARYRVSSIGGWCFASECTSWQGSDERDSFLARWDVYACSKALKA